MMGKQINVDQELKEQKIGAEYQKEGGLLHSKYLWIIGTISISGVLFLYMLTYFLSDEVPGSVKFIEVSRHALVAIGTALVIGLLMHLGVTRLALRDLRRVTEDALGVAAKELSVLHGCLKSGVTNVFPKRSDFYNHLVSCLNQLKDGDCVKIIGISLRDLFREGSTGSDPVNLLRETFTRTINDKKLRYRLCLLDPLSIPGEQRAFREEPESVKYISDTNLFDDVKYVVANQYLLKRVDSKCPYNRSDEYIGRPETQWRPESWNDIEKCIQCDQTICMCLYRTSPHCFLIILPDAVFFEQYHYGQVGGGRKGGRIPTLQLEESQESESAYQQLDGHFEYVWLTGRLVTEKTNDDFNKRIIDDLNKKSQVKNVQQKTKAENNENKSDGDDEPKK